LVEDGAAETAVSVGVDMAEAALKAAEALQAVAVAAVNGKARIMHDNPCFLCLLCGI